MEDGVIRGTRMQVTNMRKSLMSVADMNDAAQDVYFSHEAKATQFTGRLFCLRNSSEARASKSSIQKFRRDVKPMAGWHQSKGQWESLPLADALGSGTVPKGAEVEEAVRFALKPEEPANVRPLRAPWEPTKEEKDVQETSEHALFRLWRRACQAGAGRDRAHVRVERLDERANVVLAADCCFMGERDGGEANARCIHENRRGQVDALTRSPTESAEAPCGEP